jgi:hypothetical protein
VSLCTLTGNLTLIDGQAGANAQVFFNTVATQSFGGTVIPPSSFSVFTDAQGNLPPGVVLPQGAIVQVTIGTGQPVQIQIPLAATADLATLILANNDPPSVVSALAVGTGGDYGLTVTNPSTGAIGTSVLQPGKVTAIQGTGFSAVAPTDAQVPIFSSGGNQWQPESIVGDATLSDNGALSVNGIASGGNITGNPTGGPFSISNYNVNNVFNPQQYGAKLDARRIQDLSVTNGSTAVSSNAARFSPADVGKLIVIWTPGLRSFTGTITAVAAPTAVLSAPYGGTSQTNATAMIGSDDGAAVNAAIAAVPDHSSGAVLDPGLPIMTTQTISTQGRSVEFACQGMGGQVTTSAGGCVIVWAGGNAPVIQVVGSTGARVHDWAILGSDQAASQPTACVDMLNNSVTVTGTNSWNHIYNIQCGAVGRMPGQGSGHAMVGVGIVANPAVIANDDRNMVDNFRVRFANYGIQILQNQAVEWTIHDITCDTVGVCFDDHMGGNNSYNLNQIESLDSTLSFWLGRGNVVSVRDYSNADNNALTVAPPWLASTILPRDFVVTDSNGNFEQVTTSGTSGGSAPAWAGQTTHWAISSISRSASVVTVTTTAPHDFQVGQTIGITGVADASFNGTFTVASVSATQFTYVQIFSDASSSGGTAWHATVDNTVTWINIGTNSVSMFALFGSGGGGGTLQAIDSVYTASQFQPYNGDLMAGTDNDFTFVGENFRVAINSAGQPTTVSPMINLTGVGACNRNFFCYACEGITQDNFTVAVGLSSVNPLTYIDVQRLSGPQGPGAGAGLGEYFINALVNGDSSGVDAFRYDFPGKIREFGGPLAVKQLPSPTLFGLSCATPGSTTWFYKVTAVSGSGESSPSSELSIANCASSVSSTNFIQGSVKPVLGADSYKIYRSTAAGGSGSEAFSLSIAANQPGFAGGSANAFQDVTPDGSLGGAPPTANTTGNAMISGVLAVGTGAATGAASGDVSASRGASQGVLWLGSNGSQSLDFGVSNAGTFSLLGGGLVAPALRINGTGQLFMGNIPAASLPSCTASNKFSWLTVTDQTTACAYGASPAGGGANVCPVFCDGSAWKIH